MEFSGQYLTYLEYKALGGTLDQTPFNILEFEARRQIDIRTFNRIKELDSVDIPQEVKLCDYNLINSIESFNNSANAIASNGNVKSENTDGYTIQYISANEISEVVKSKQNEIDDIVRSYLLGVIVDGQHIMYCGV